MKILGTAFLLVMTTVAVANTVPPDNKILVDRTRTIKLIGEVNQGIIDTASELLKLSTDSQNPIFIIINSPGGSVIPGNIFVDAIKLVKARGITIKCIVPVLAASMAFTILAECSERYTLSNSLLLFHPVRTGSLPGPVTAQSALAHAKRLTIIDDALIKNLLASMGMNKELFLEAFYAERLWGAADLLAAVNPGWMTITDNILGIDDIIFSLEAEGATRRSTQEGGKELEPRLHSN